MDGRFRTRLCRARRLNRSWSLPAEATGRAYRLGCRSRRFQPVFGVYNFADEKPAQCTIRRQNRTFGRFFVREIVHIEAFMSMDDAMRARGHCSRSDSDVTDKGLRSALPSTPLAGAETDAIGSCAPRTAFPCPSVPPRAAAWSHLGVLSTRGYEESWGQMIRIRSKFAGLESPRDKHIAWRAKIGSYCLGAWRNWQTQGT